MSRLLRFVSERIMSKFYWQYIFICTTQVVCDANGTITSIVARWPGSSHDSRIFTESTIKRDLESRNEDNAWLLGDSGYVHVA